MTTSKATRVFSMQDTCNTWDDPIYVHVEDADLSAAFTNVAAQALEFMADRYGQPQTVTYTEHNTFADLALVFGADEYEKVCRVTLLSKAEVAALVATLTTH